MVVCLVVFALRTIISCLFSFPSLFHRHTHSRYVMSDVILLWDVAVEHFFFQHCFIENVKLTDYFELIVLNFGL